MPRRSRNPDSRTIWERINQNSRDIAVIRNDVSWIKHGLRKIDKRLWYIATAVVGFGIIGILIALVG